MSDSPANEQREVVLAGLADSVWKLDAAMATEFAHRAVAIGMDAYEAINDGLAKGMMVVSGNPTAPSFFPQTERSWLTSEEAKKMMTRRWR